MRLLAAAVVVRLAAYERDLWTYRTVGKYFKAISRFVVIGFQWNCNRNVLLQSHKGGWPAGPRRTQSFILFDPEEVVRRTVSYFIVLFSTTTGIN